jgi:hypothetical protein
MSKKKPSTIPSLRSVKHTTLFVVEGETEALLIKYINGLYSHGGGTRVSVVNARGKGSNHVYDKAFRCHAGYSCVVLLYDMDKPPNKGNKDRARKLKFNLIEVVPAIEALYLEILGIKRPPTTRECKRTLHEALAVNNMLDRKTLEKHFPSSLLSERRITIPNLERIFQFIRPCDYL